MVRESYRNPSPIRSGIVHAGLSLSVFGGIAAVIGAGIHFTGNASAAGPRQVIALFEVAPTDAPSLTGRLPDQTLEADRQDYAEPALQYSSFNYDEPSLGVPSLDETDDAKFISAAEQPQIDGIRINGKFVPAGQSLSQVTKQETTPQPAAMKIAAPVLAPKAISTEGLYERSSVGNLPIIAEDGRTVAAAYARPFANPENKPTVSLIVGGLGTARNGKYTKAAIEELPPEITLSFVANATNLKTLIRRARAAGHEVIIEAPMEAYETGRRRAHPRQLSTIASKADNANNLAWVLSRADGYFAIMNYEGGKFATDEAAVAPVMQELARRGVGFFETGTLPGSVLKAEAQRASGYYSLSSEVVDAQADSTAIEERLSELERLALENGKALGTGFPYPVTIDTVKAWAERLESKGIVLAPASSTFTIPNVQPVTASKARAATSDGAR